MKLAGTALILLGSLGGFLGYSIAQRQELNLLRDIIAALGTLESSIRWKKLPLPDGIRELAARQISGNYFAEIDHLVTGGSTLQKAWNKVFREIDPESADILCRMEWQGDTEQIEGCLRHCAEQLKAQQTERQSSLHQRERLCGAATLSAAGILIILLM